MMTKLYKTVAGRGRYYEAWTDEGQVVVHWGPLGRVGQSKTYPKPKKQSDKNAIKEALQEARQQVYAEIDEKNHDWVIVQYRIKGFGSKRDFAKLERVEDRLNSRLGWTGLGHVDGNDIGSGTMSVFCLVVDADLAVKTIISDLRRGRDLSGAAMATRGPDEDEATIVYPARSKGQELPF
jgi:predicted DNA-binding WGR domain protein